MTELTQKEIASRFYQKGCAAKQQGNLQIAYQSFCEAVNLDPDDSAHHLNLAIVANNIAQAQDPFREQAMIHAARAAEMAPDSLGNWIALGEIALHCNKFPDAASAFEEAIKMDTKNANIHGLCGFAYGKMGDTKKSIEFCEKAVALDPEIGHFHFLLSCAYYGDEYFDAKKLAFHGERGFLAPKPSRLALESKWNAAHGFLGMGDYLKGFEYLEARLQRNATNVGQQLMSERFSKPVWGGQTHVDDGGMMRPAIIRVVSEMGLGDCFCMARYLPVIEKQFGVKIVFESHKSMIHLTRYNFPSITCIEYGDQEFSDFDYYIPMMSLPVICKTTIDSVPWNGAYLNSEPERFTQWDDENIWEETRLKKNIGICWSAGQRSWNAENNATFKRKSVPFMFLEPILDNDDFNFVSLQVGLDEQFQNPGIKDFSDTAAIIGLCDIIITVDSAVANLAGAMGKEVWLMDRRDHDWRWNGVWYPTAKVFRQTTQGEWLDVIEKIHRELEAIHGKIAA